MSFYSKLKSILKIFLPSWLTRRMSCFFSKVDSLFFPYKKVILELYIMILPRSHKGYERLLSQIYKYRFKDVVAYSKLYISYYEKYKLINPKAVLNTGRPATRCYLFLHDIKALEETMDEYYSIQEEVLNSTNLSELNIQFINGNIFSGYNVHAYLDTHIKAMELGWKSKKRLVQLSGSNETISNPIMFRYWRKYVTFIDDEKLAKELLPLSRYLEQDISFVANLKGKYKYIEHAKCVVQKEWEKQKRKPLFELDDEDISFGRNKLLEKGIPGNAWFVCLHVRDSGYKTGSHLNEELYDSYRNSDIDTYKLAIKEIVKRGGYVIRVGDANMKPVDEMEGLFDYSHSDIRSNRMDIYLFSQCRFFVGVSSGPVLTPVLFGVPVVMSNFAPISGRPHAGNCLFIPKMLWLKEEERYASFEEVLSSDISRIFTSEGYEDRNIKLVDNSEEELRDVVIEMMDKLDGKMSYTDEDEQRQNKLTKLYQEYSGYGDMGRIGNTFIKKYADQGLLSI